MNDMTKARYFLKTNGSDLQHLTSFGLMFATAEQRYREIRIKKQGNREGAGAYEKREVQAALDYAVLKYLKKYNRLPPTAPQAFAPGVTLEEKRTLAEEWARA